MLKKQSLPKFYEDLVTIHHTFDTIVANNNELESSYYAENPHALLENENKLRKKLDSLEEIMSPDERFILFHIKSINVKNLVIDLFNEMRTYEFSSVSSVPGHVQMQHLTDKYSRYDVFNEIKLNKHTINCAICAIEVCKNGDIPDRVRENLIILSILHDFGKSPLLVEKLPDSKNTSNKIKHNVYSALYAEIHLKKYIGNSLPKETYLTIIQTLKDHHNEYAEDSLLLNLLKLSDFSARDKEEKFALSKKNPLVPSKGEV